MVGKAYACTFRRVTAAGLTTLVATALAFVPPATASAVDDPQSDPNWREKRLAQWPDLPESPSTPGRYHLPGSPIPAASMPAVTAAAVKWPTAAAADISVPAGPAAAAPRPQATANVGGLPVRLQRPAGTNASALNARVEVLDQATAKAAGMTGVMLKVSPAGVTDTGDVQLSVDYTSLVRASGGDWASRLRLVALPACAAVTPQLRECHQITPLKSTNDIRTKTVTAIVSLSGAGRETAGRPDGSVTLDGQVYALQAAASGPNGDWSATPLNPSATWDVSAQTGDFSWSYALPVPPSVGGPAPDLALSYSSGSVDGKVASTNNQTSWIGDGWELDNGYVERKYVSCAQDATGNANNVNHKTGDLCWKSDNATLSLNGRASELIKDKTSGEWRLKNDDASKVERLTGAWNGDNDTEYWKVTTSDGRQYFFGRDQRSASDTTALSSAWTVPVYGNNPNEPCYDASFARSYCDQAWRWNLDYVVDPHGNTMTYFYTPEWNYYGRDRNSSVSRYVRGGYLTAIEYGERSGSEASTTAPMRVEFGVAERCLSNCSVLNESTKENWPDVPYDRICSSSTSCPEVMSPAFFTRKRLTTITTKVYNGTGYDNVESWTLAHSFPDPGDGTSNAVLWLNSIEHKGLRGSTVTLPKVTFTGVQMANRVDTAGDIAAAMIRYRMQAITNETGGRITINYDPADCTPTSLPANPQTNTRRCMPVYWTPEGAEDPVLEYFHKYRVDYILADPYAYTISSRDPMVKTDWVYQDAPAWHYDDNELVKPKERTWGEFRGYGTVDVITGEAPTQTAVRYRYFRGMDDDHLPGGGKRQVTIDGIEDHDQFAGMLREEITYNGPGGAEVTATVNTPWLSAATATGADGTTANYVNTGTVETRTAAPSLAGGVRRTKTVTKFDDAYGMPEWVDDRGDTATDDDDLCTRYQYARNTTLNITSTISRTETVSEDCDTAPQRPADVVKDERWFYDGGGFGAAPTRGLVTKVEQARSFTGSTPVYGAPVSTTTYDPQGRELTVTDALGRTKSTTYTPASGGPLTRTTATTPDPDGTTGPLTPHTVITDLDPAYGKPTKVTDPNSKATQAAYDGLGRLTKVWMPGRTTSQTPDLEYSYFLQATAPNAIVTKKLIHDGTQTSTVQLFDGLLRPRQTQATAAGEGGKVLTDTRYDSRGLKILVNGDYKDTMPVDPANPQLFIPSTSVAGHTEYIYDGVGRVTDEVFYEGASEKWRTVTAYGGDRVSVDPPTGGVPTTTLTDARGRTTQLWQHKGPSPAAPAQVTTYEYDHAGQLAKVTDPDGNRWTYGYDLLGRQTSSVDPDKGTTESTYDDAGQLLTTKDVGRAKTLAYKYDNLGRKIELHDTSLSGTLQAKWIYDTLAKNHLTSATRYVGSAAYTTAVTGYDNGYRPLGQSVTLPSTGVPTGEAAIAGTYTTDFTYTIDGQIKTVVYNATANLGKETVTTYYDNVNMPEWMTGGLGWGVYVAGANWSAYGQQTFLDLGNTYYYHLSSSYEEATKRLSTSQLLRQGAAGMERKATYSYDAAGNVLSVIDRPQGQTVDAQCFRYPDDQLRRLTEAWTPDSASCANTPTAWSQVDDNPAPYWMSWTFDALGNRKTESRRSAAGPTNRTFNYPAGGAGVVRPHAVTRIDETGPGGNKTYTYGYDNAGNTTCRPSGTASNTCPSGTGSQTLTWDNEGRLDTVSGGNSYVYTADGERLLRRENGVTTVYLPGGQELRLTVATGVKTAQRFYTFAGQVVATRTGTGLAGVSTLVPDHHATAELSIANTTNTVTWRRHDPYGNIRGAAPSSWPGDHDFLNKPKDATGLTHIGAREYDPGIGRFISVDPIMDVADPQQWNGYAYSNNSPATFSDPSGLKQCGDDRCTVFETVSAGGVHTIHNGGSSASTRYTGRTHDGRPYPNTSKGEHWTPQYFSEFFYGTHITNAQQNHALFTDMCEKVGEGCEGLDNRAPGVNWGHVAEGVITLIVIAAAPECLAAAVVCANAIGDGIVSFYGYGGGGGAASGAGAAGRTAGGATAARTAAGLSDEMAATFSGGRYTTSVLSKDTIFYRAGVQGKPLGQFFSTEKPVGVLQTRIDKAIPPYWADGAHAPLDTGYAIRIPKGTTIYSGEVANQGGIYMGGTGQTVVLQPWNISGVEVVDSWPLR